MENMDDLYMLEELDDISLHDYGLPDIELFRGGMATHSLDIADAENVPNPDANVMLAVMSSSEDNAKKVTPFMLDDDHLFDSPRVSQKNSRSNRSESFSSEDDDEWMLEGARRAVLEQEEGENISIEQAVDEHIVEDNDACAKSTDRENFALAVSPALNREQSSFQAENFNSAKEAESEDVGPEKHHARDQVQPERRPLSDESAYAEDAGSNCAQDGDNELSFRSYPASGNRSVTSVAATEAGSSRISGGGPVLSFGSSVQTPVVSLNAKADGATTTTKTTMFSTPVRVARQGQNVSVSIRSNRSNMEETPYVTCRKIGDSELTSPSVSACSITDTFTPRRVVNFSAKGEDQKGHPDSPCNNNSAADVLMGELEHLRSVNQELSVALSDQAYVQSELTQHLLSNFSTIFSILKATVADGDEDMEGDESLQSSEERLSKQVVRIVEMVQRMDTSSLYRREAGTESQLLVLEARVRELEASTKQLQVACTTLTQEKLRLQTEVETERLHTAEKLEQAKDMFQTLDQHYQKIMEEERMAHREEFAELSRRIMEETPQSVLCMDGNADGSSFLSSGSSPSFMKEDGVSVMNTAILSVQKLLEARLPRLGENEKILTEMRQIVESGKTIPEQLVQKTQKIHNEIIDALQHHDEALAQLDLAPSTGVSGGDSASENGTGTSNLCVDDPSTAPVMQNHVQQVRDVVPAEVVNKNELRRKVNETHAEKQCEGAKSGARAQVDALEVLTGNLQETIIVLQEQLEDKDAKLEKKAKEYDALKEACDHMHNELVEMEADLHLARDAEDLVSRLQETLASHERTKEENQKQLLLLRKEKEDLMADKAQTAQELDAVKRELEAAKERYDQTLAEIQHKDEQIRVAQHRADKYKARAARLHHAHQEQIRLLASKIDEIGVTDEKSYEIIGSMIERQAMLVAKDRAALSKANAARKEAAEKLQSLATLRRSQSDQLDPAENAVVTSFVESIERVVRALNFEISEV